MARRTRYSAYQVLQPLIQAVICGAGLLGGIAVGGLIVFSTGLLRKSGRALSASFSSMTTGDMLIVIGSVAIVSGLGWLGARIGVALAMKMQR